MLDTTICFSYISLKSYKSDIPYSTSEKYTHSSTPRGHSNFDLRTIVKTRIHRNRKRSSPSDEREFDHVKYPAKCGLKLKVRSRRRCKM